MRTSVLVTVVRNARNSCTRGVGLTLSGLGAPHSTGPVSGTRVLVSPAACICVLARVEAPCRGGRGRARTRKKRTTMRPIAQREMTDPGSVASDKSLSGARCRHAGE